METKTIRIKYFTDKIDRLAYIGGKSDWIDLRCAKEVQMKAGEFRLIPWAWPCSCRKASRPMSFPGAVP